MYKRPLMKMNLPVFFACCFVLVLPSEAGVARLCTEYIYGCGETVGGSSQDDCCICMEYVGTSVNATGSLFCAVYGNGVFCCPCTTSQFLSGSSGSSESSEGNACDEAIQGVRDIIDESRELGLHVVGVCGKDPTVSLETSIQFLDIRTRAEAAISRVYQECPDII